MDNLIVEKLKSFFDLKPEIILAMLYGSCARGTEHKNSDVDIAVAAHDVLTLDYRLSLQLELSILLKKEIDLVDIRKIDGLLHYKVFTEGICIKKIKKHGETLFHKNFMSALYWYEDFYPIYERGRKSILEHAFG